MNSLEFAQAIEKRWEAVNKYLYYGIQIQPKLVSVDINKNEMVAEWLVTEDHINNGFIDEGCLGTVTDNTTSMLIGVLIPNGQSVSTSISIQGTMAASAQDIKLKEAIQARLQSKSTIEYFGKELPVSIASVSHKNQHFSIRFTVTENEINSSGTLEEGWIATTTDNMTSILMTGLSDNPFNVTTSLSINVLSKIEAGTEIIIDCTVNAIHQPPNAEAVFRHAKDATKVFAVGSHTKFFKPKLAEQDRTATPARL
ncbi:hypothetical protein GGI12_000740 [Dipsacomyces acuminosporus]|nr:hypothetical protein GGI12_000740 [Dipsacomyces acuminosporus]